MVSGGRVRPPFGNQNLLYIYHIKLILLVMKNLLGYIGSLSEEKKLSDVPDTVEHHARQVSGERESAGGEP